MQFAVMFVACHVGWDAALWLLRPRSVRPPERDDELPPPPTIP